MQASYLSSVTASLATGEELAVIAATVSPSFAVSNPKRGSERFSALDKRHLRGEKLDRGVWDNLPGFRRVLDYGILGVGESEATRCPQGRKGTRLLLVE